MNKWTTRILVILLLVSLAAVPLATNYFSNQNKQKIQLAEQSQKPVKTATADGVYVELNKLRGSSGLEAFKRNPKLDESARLKCEDMVANNYYDHVNPATKKQGWSYIKDVGLYYKSASENLLEASSNTSEGIVGEWKASDAHYAAILDPKYTETGVALCNGNRGYILAVQHMLEPAQAASQPTTRQSTTCTSTPTVSGSLITTCN